MNWKSFAGFLICIILCFSFAFSVSSVYRFIDPAHGIWTDISRVDHSGVKTLIIKGLKSEVKVVWDKWGVPHIYASNEEDLFFAYGYVQALERLWQMDLIRRLASGRLSEILGNTTLESDIFYRTIGLSRAAEVSLEACDQEILKILECYSNGVNAAILDLKKADRLPLEFKLLGYVPERWSPRDVLLVDKLIGWGLTGDFYDIEFLKVVKAFGWEKADELFPLKPEKVVHIYPGESYVEVPPSSLEGLNEILRWKSEADKWTKMIVGDLFASNNWAVDGSLTASGKPILCNDPHLAHVVPPTWFEAHLVVVKDGEVSLNVRGVSFPGVPVIVIGANQYLAWGFTNVGADVIDFYYYVWSDDGRKYWYVNHWEDVTTKVEEIRVKGSESKILCLNFTRHGVLIERNDVKFAMRWAGAGATLEPKAIYLYNKAKSLDEFIEAMKYFHVPAQNHMIADIYGNIAWFANGRYPIRGNVSSANMLRVPFNGSRADGEWIGWVEPPWMVPYKINPECHYLVTANNNPVPDDYPYWLGWTWAPRYRAERILELLKDRSNLTVEDMKEIQYDVYLILGRELTPILLSAFKTKPEDELASQALDILASWDYRMTVDQVAPTIFAVWVSRFREETFGDEYEKAGLDAPYPTYETLEVMAKAGNATWFDDVNTSVVESRDDIIRRSFLNAISELREKLGDNISDWTWGSVHKLKIDHALGVAVDWLNYPRLPVNGWRDTVNPAGGYEVSHGASWRMIIDLSDINSSFCIIPGGESGNPFSPNYDSQLELWVSGEYKRFSIPVNPDEVEDMVGSLILTPGGGE